MSTFPDSANFGRQNFFRLLLPMDFAPATRNMATIGTIIDTKYPQSEIQKLRMPLFCIWKILYAGRIWNVSASTARTTDPPIKMALIHRAAPYPKLA